MTAKADFTPEEWQVMLEGPPSDGMIVVTAQRGGTFRETIAMAKAYVEARKQHEGRPRKGGSPAPGASRSSPR